MLLFRIYRAGDHMVRLRLGAVELPGSPIGVRIEPGSVSARHCYIAHDATRAAADASAVSPGGGRLPMRVPALTLLTADCWGNPVTHGGVVVTAKMSGPGACSTAVEDNLDGSYTVSWSAVLSGIYRVGVLVGGAHVTGSPFAVQVKVSPNELLPAAPPPVTPSFVAWSPRSTGSVRNSPRSLAGSAPQQAGLGAEQAGPGAVISCFASSCSLSSPSPRQRAASNRTSNSQAWRG